MLSRTAADSKQNRRAKIKMIAKKGMETGEGCDSIPESMRQYLALNFDPNTAPARSLINKASGVLSNPMADASSGKTCMSTPIFSFYDN